MRVERARPLAVDKMTGYLGVPLQMVGGTYVLQDYQIVISRKGAPCDFTYPMAKVEEGKAWFLLSEDFRQSKPGRWTVDLQKCCNTVCRYVIDLPKDACLPLDKKQAFGDMCSVGELNTCPLTPEPCPIAQTPTCAVDCDPCGQYTCVKEEVLPEPIC